MCHLVQDPAGETRMEGGGSQGHRGPDSVGASPCSYSKPWESSEEGEVGYQRQKLAFRSQTGYVSFPPPHSQMFT